MAWRVERTDRVRGHAFAKATRIFMATNPKSSSGARYAEWARWKGAALVLPDNMLEATIPLIATCDAAIIPAPSLGEYQKFYKGPKLKVIVCGGCHLDRDIARRALETMTETIWSSYGQTELSAIAGGGFALIESIPNAVGRVFDDMIVEIRDGSIWANRKDRPLIDTDDLGHFVGDILCVSGRKR